MVSSTVISYMLQDVFRKVVQGTTKILHNRSESGSAGHVIQPCLYMRRSIQSHMPGTSAFAFVM